MALEHRKDIRLGELEWILEKLEQKGARNSILKYNQMSELRARINQQVQRMLDQQINSTEVLDSSHVIGGLCIKKFLKRRRMAKARAQADANKVETGVGNIEPIQEAASEGSSNNETGARANNTNMPGVEVRQSIRSMNAI